MDRPLQIVFRDLGRSAFLTGRIRERVQHLERVYSHIIGCRVVVEASHRSVTAAVKPLAISVEVELPGRPKIVAKSSANSARSHLRNGSRSAAINHVFDAVQRRLEEAAAILKGNVKKHERAFETGVVARVFPDQNHGFVEVKGSPDLYFSRAAVSKGEFDLLEAGAMVQVLRAPIEGPMGPQASTVRVIEPPMPGRRKPRPTRLYGKQ